MSDDGNDNAFGFSQPVGEIPQSQNRGFGFVDEPAQKKKY